MICDSHFHPFLTSVHQNFDSAQGLALATSPSEWEPIFALKAKNSNLKIAFGIDPMWLEFAAGLSHDDAFLEHLHFIFQKTLYENASSIAALGECGFHLPKGIAQNPRIFDWQKKVFDWHYQAAQELQKPLIAHFVGNFQTIYEILSAYDWSQLTLVWHGFTGGPGLIKQFKPMVAYFGLGPLFWKNLSQPQWEGFFTKFQDFILLESDYPQKTFLNPASYSQEITNLKALISKKTEPITDQLLTKACQNLDKMLKIPK